MSKNEFKSVSEAFRSIAGSDSNNALTEQMHRRQLVKALTALRVSKGLTQTEVADELGCHQSKISKLERGMDSDLTIREIEAYAKLSEKDIVFLFSKRNQTLADQIKHHAFMIRSAFENLVELAQKDGGIAGGVAQLYFETFMNVNKFLQETSEKLPVRAGSGKPYIRIAEGSGEPTMKADSGEEGCDDRRLSRRKASRTRMNAAEDQTARV